MFRGASKARAVPIGQVKWLVWAGVGFHFSATGPLWAILAVGSGGLASADGSCSCSWVVSHITLGPGGPTDAHRPATCAAQVRHHDSRGAPLVLCPRGIGPHRREMFCWSRAALSVLPGPN